MTVGMIQSNYLPWRGYFDFIDDVDLFIFYDDVQYTHRDWRNRNTIKTKEGLCWISVPVLHDRDTLVQSAAIDYSQRWRDKHIKTISLTYSKASFYKDYSQELFDIIQTKYHTISELNIELIKWTMNKLDIKTRLGMSKDFKVDGDKYERPLNIMEKIGATSYLSGPTAKPYTDSTKYQQAGIELKYKSYEYLPYNQLWGPFEPNVSIIDLLFNCGPDAYGLIKSTKENVKIFDPARMEFSN